MSRWRERLAIVAVAAGAAAAGFFASRHETPTAAPPSQAEGAGDALLRLTLPDLNRVPQSLAQWQGKVLVVNFWATWCPPCRREMPAFSRVSEKYAAKGVQFVGISVDTAENVQEYQHQTPVSYPLLLGSAADLALTAPLGNGSQALPFTAILDRGGRVRRIKLGALSEDALEAALGELTAERPAGERSL